MHKHKIVKKLFFFGFFHFKFIFINFFLIFQDFFEIVK